MADESKESTGHVYELGYLGMKIHAQPNILYNGDCFLEVFIYALQKADDTVRKAVSRRVRENMDTVFGITVAETQPIHVTISLLREILGSLMLTAFADTSITWQLNDESKLPQETSVKATIEGIRDRYGIDKTKLNSFRHHLYNIVRTNKHWLERSTIHLLGRFMGVNFIVANIFNATVTYNRSSRSTGFTWNNPYRVDVAPVTIPTIPSGSPIVSFLSACVLNHYMMCAYNDASSFTPGVDIANNGIKIIEDDIRKTGAEYIAHQCNCTQVGGSAGGVAGKIFETYPKTNIHYKNVVRTPGDIIVRKQDSKNIINMLSQDKPGGRPDTMDEDTWKTISKQREDWFRECLQKIGKHIGTSSVWIAFPYKVGCGIANGSWDAYSNMPTEFSMTHKNITVVLYRHIFNPSA